MLRLAPSAQVAPAVCVEPSVSNGQQYLRFFGSDTLKRLHGCAIAEHGHGSDSPCQGLAQPLRRPQIGFGNPQAPIVFLSSSPLDVTSTSNEAFAEWLEHESGLEHHMTSHTPHPYFQFVRAVFKEARHRLAQKPAKHEVLDLAFHTWAIRCATENPDRITDAALNQCVDRHLQSLLGGINPKVVIALGGPIARHLFWQSRHSWDGWGPMTALHGQVLNLDIQARSLPAILSMHPYQKGVDLHPDVIGRALADRLQAADLEPHTELKAA